MVPPTQVGIKFFLTLQNPKTRLYETFLSSEMQIVYNKDGYRRIGELNCDLPTQTLSEFPEIQSDAMKMRHVLNLPQLPSEQVNVAELLEQAEREESKKKKREHLMKVFKAER